MASSNTPCWEAPKFSFNVQNQAEEKKLFYTRAVDFLKALDINPDAEDQPKRGACQIRMSEGDKRQALQTLLNNTTITAEVQCTPIQALNLIQTVIKEDVHFWHHQDKILSDIHQHSDGGIHVLNTSITALVNKSKFTKMKPEKQST